MTDPSGSQVHDDRPAAYEKHVQVIMNPFINLLLDRIEPEPGSSLLDVACGTGFVARAAARRVGQKGRVAGVDVDEGMLAIAEERAPRTAPTIEWQQASAQELPFEDGSFDAVVSQQGIQLFEDLEAAVVELARVTAPRGTVAVTAWGPIERSPYFDAQLTAVREVLGDEALGDEALTSFAREFDASGDSIQAAFEAAGLTNVTAELVEPEVSLPATFTYAPAQIKATALAPAFAEAGTDRRARIVRRIADLLLEDTIDSRPLVPFSSWIVFGTR
jgi:SAM-dependent methyltransferase